MPWKMSAKVHAIDKLPYYGQGPELWSYFPAVEF